MDTTDPESCVPADPRPDVRSNRIMPHQRMVQRWRSVLADPVSPEIISYVHYDGCWWRRTNGRWESIPDGPLASALAAGHARLARARDRAGLRPAARGRDPWAIARNRQRTGIVCRRPEAFMPMRAFEPRPYPPATCQRTTID